MLIGCLEVLIGCLGAGELMVWYGMQQCECVCVCVCVCCTLTGNVSKGVRYSLTKIAPPSPHPYSCIR